MSLACAKFPHITVKCCMWFHAASLYISTNLHFVLTLLLQSSRFCVVLCEIYEQFRRYVGALLMQCCIVMCRMWRTLVRLTVY